MECLDELPCSISSGAHSAHGARLTMRIGMRAGRLQLVNADGAATLLEGIVVVETLVV